MAQRIQRDARVVYVDNDPAVLVRGRALLQENDQTHVVAADIFRPAEVVHNEIVRKYLDFTQPIALYHCGTMHHYSGERSPHDIVQEYIDAIPAGSYVVLSHFFDPETPELSPLARKVEEILVNSLLGNGWFRTRSKIEDMLTGLELVEPGLTACADWWPDGPRIKPITPARYCIIGAVGRKP